MLIIPQHYEECRNDVVNNSKGGIANCIYFGAIEITGKIIFICEDPQEQAPLYLVCAGDSVGTEDYVKNYIDKNRSFPWDEAYELGSYCSAEEAFEAVDALYRAYKIQARVFPMPKAK